MESIWPSFRLDPREPQHATLRASDTDRALVSSVLADAYADGRLTAAEYDERESANLAAKTLGELPPLLTDLVGPVGQASKAVVVQSPAQLRQAAVRQHIRDTWETTAAASTPFLLCLVIWLFTSPGDYFWPMWAAIPMVLAAGSEIVGAPAAVKRKQARLEREQTEALEPPPAGDAGDAD